MFVIRGEYVQSEFYVGELLMKIVICLETTGFILDKESSMSTAI